MVLLGTPAPAGMEVVVDGTSVTIQCQNPLPVGACGSYELVTPVSW
jgi:hypothetical protein